MLKNNLCSSHKFFFLLQKLILKEELLWSTQKAKKKKKKVIIFFSSITHIYTSFPNECNIQTSTQEFHAVFWAYLGEMREGEVV